MKPLSFLVMTFVLVGIAAASLADVVLPLRFGSSNPFSGGAVRVRSLAQVTAEAPDAVDAADSSSIYFLASGLAGDDKGPGWASGTDASSSVITASPDASPSGQSANAADLVALCYGQPCNSASVCAPNAVLNMPSYVNYKTVTGNVTFSRAHMMPDCSSTSGCQLAVTGGGTLDTSAMEKTNSTSYSMTVQATSDSTPAQIWYLPQSCNGTTSQVLMHTIHYDDKPPYLTIVRTIGNVATTISSTMPTTTGRRLQSREAASPQRTQAHRHLLASSGAQTLLFEFSEPVVGFSQDSIYVQNGKITSFTSNADNTTYTAVLIPTSSSSAMKVMVGKDSYTDYAGNSGSATIDSTVSTAATPAAASTTQSASGATGAQAGLGAGAIAGIVIGGVFWIIFLVLLVLLMRYCMRRKHERETAAAKTAPTGKGAGAGGPVAVTAATGAPKDIEGGKELPRKLLPQKSEPAAELGMQSDFSRANMRSAKSELPVSRPANMAVPAGSKQTRFGSAAPIKRKSVLEDQYATPAASFSAPSTTMTQPTAAVNRAAAAPSGALPKYGSGSYDGPILRYSSGLEEVHNPVKSGPEQPDASEPAGPEAPASNPLFDQQNEMRSKMSEAEMHAMGSPNALYGTRTAGKAWDSVDLQGNDDEFHSPAGSRRVSTT